MVIDSILGRKHTDLTGPERLIPYLSVLETRSTISGASCVAHTRPLSDACVEDGDGRKWRLEGMCREGEAVGLCTVLRVLESQRMPPQVALEPMDCDIVCSMPRGEIPPSLDLPHTVLGFIA